VEAGPSVLATFPESLRASARASLARLGVEVREATRVVAVDERGATLQSSAGGERVEAATVLWAAGVVASPLVATLGVPLDRAGRVLVEPDLSIPGHPDVFVVGDAAAFLHQGGQPLPGVVQPAMQGARHAARTILDRLAGRAPRKFVYRDFGNMAIIGRASAVADLGWVRFSGLFGWLAWLFLHIVKLIGFRNRIVVLVEWAAAYFTIQRGARLILGMNPPPEPPRPPI
jgi:NADH dehydrogenase